MPGWFPLVVEPLRKVSPGPTGTVEADVLGSRMRLDMDDYMQRKLWYQALEPGVVRQARRILRRGDTAVDVGANAGYYTLLFARLVGVDGVVQAFEPVLADRLRGNVALNGYANVVVYEVAAGSERGDLVVGRYDNPAGYSSGDFGRGGPHEQRRVDVIPLDEILGDRAVRLVKIDVEGMEPDVLAGMQAALREHRVHAVVLEVAGENLEAPQQITQPLLDAGYDLFRIGEFGRLHRLDPGARHRAGPVGLYYLVAFRPDGN